MPQIQLSGLASGFDWKSVVDQLIALERTPQNRLKQEKTDNSSKLSVYSTLRTKLTSLQDAVKALSSDSLFGDRRVSFEDEETTWSATAGSGATPGQYTFNVTQLATRSVLTGGGDISGSLDSDNDVSDQLISELRIGQPVQAGTFSINGKQIEVADTDTLQDVFDRISTATGGAVTASYDSTTDKVTLSSAGTITLGSSADTSNFLYALKLYNNGGTSVASASALGTLGLNDSIDSAGLRSAITAVDAEGKGGFTINGVKIEYDLDADSLQAVMNRVNDSDAGVTMAYDAVNDRFTLTNKNTGSLAITVAEDAGGLLDALGVQAGGSVVLGENAELTVQGGGTIVSASNSFDPTLHGIAGLTVNATSVGEQTVTVASDTDGVEEGIRKFITAFNDVQKYVDEQTKVTLGSDGKVTAALMAGNRELTDIARQLRSDVFAEVPGLTGTIRRLEAIGVDFEGNSSELQVRDEAKFSDALANNVDEVAALFSSASTGISAQIDSYITQLTTTDGLIDSQEESLERQNTSLDQQIADLDRRLETERTRLEEGFIRMEQAQSQINSQLAALQRTLNLG